MSAPRPDSARQRRPLRPLPALIFMSRWLQVPLYLGLIVAQGVYVVLFLKEVWHLVSASMTLDEEFLQLKRDIWAKLGLKARAEAAVC